MPSRSLLRHIRTTNGRGITCAKVVHTAPDSWGQGGVLIPLRCQTSRALSTTCMLMHQLCNSIWYTNTQATRAFYLCYSLVIPIMHSPYKYNYYIYR